MIVTIDGPAGSGKSTVAHALAERYGLTLLDTGAMYRSVTLACMQRGVDDGDTEEVARVARDVRITFKTAEDGSQHTLLDGKDVSSDIRTPEVDAHVSAVSAIPEVREAMVAQQRTLAQNCDMVCEGRDMGTIVFPAAEVKVFLTADAAARAHRRAVQRAGGDAATNNDVDVSASEEQAILADLERRDAADSSREVAPLRPAEDAVHIDSSSLTVDEVVGRIGEQMQAAGCTSARQVGQDQHAPLAQAPAPVLEPSPDATPAPSEDVAPEQQERSRNGEPKKGPLHVFGHNSLDDYYDHPVREFPITSRALLAATIGVCGLLSKLLWPWRIENGEALWNAEGGQVVVMNHVSMIDPVIVVVSDWAHGRRMRPIYKSEFDKHRIVTWFFARVGAIPVKRGTADIKVVRRAQRALQRGEDVLVFPEGTRILSEDQKVEIHGGFALMAQLAKAPVLPIAIIGARDGAPGGNKPLRPHRIFLRAGKQVTFDMLSSKKRKKQTQEMEALAMEQVYELRDALRAEHPGVI